eukprot:SAG11_NODE_650_length_7931_cov_9.512385_3_plen_116_part_00
MKKLYVSLFNALEEELEVYKNKWHLYLCVPRAPVVFHRLFSLIVFHRLASTGTGLSSKYVIFLLILELILVASRQSSAIVSTKEILYLDIVYIYRLQWKQYANDGTPLGKTGVNA